MLNEKNIVKIIAVGPLIFIPLITVAISLLIAKTSSDNFKENIEKIETKLVNIERKAIKARVDSIASHITYRKSVIKGHLTSRVQQRVNRANEVAASIYERYRDTKSDKEIKDIIIIALKPHRWNDGDSFIEIVTDKDTKEGFCLDLNQQFEQVSFVKAFGHYDWYFCLSEYLDTAQKKLDADILESLEKMYELSTNYVMINTIQGDILLNRTLPELIGKNAHDVDKPILLVIQNKAKKLLSKKDSGFVEYTWMNQTTKEKETKHTYVRKISNSDWVVASGYFESTIKGLAAKKSLELYKAHNVKVKNLLIISSILILISLIISYIISKQIKKSYILYQNKINHKSIELQKLNETLEHRVITRTKELEGLTEELEVLATTDSLTRIHNRYSIMNILKIEIHRSIRYNQALSIIMYDIDYFKDINDSYGHDAGDKVLFELTNVVKSSLRELDFIGRYGGEEFLVIMPTTTLESAKEIAIRIRKEVGKHNFDNGIKLTISLGLVELQENEDTNAVFKRLDNLLYDSKHDGRNKLSF